MMMSGCCGGSDDDASSNVRRRRAPFSHDKEKINVISMFYRLHEIGLKWFDIHHTEHIHTQQNTGAEQKHTHVTKCVVACYLTRLLGCLLRFRYFIDTIQAGRHSKWHGMPDVARGRSEKVMALLFGKCLVLSG